MGLTFIFNLEDANFIDVSWLNLVASAADSWICSVSHGLLVLIFLGFVLLCITLKNKCMA